MRTTPTAVLSLLRAGFEANDVAAQAQVAIAAPLVAWGLHDDLEFGLEPGAVGEVRFDDIQTLPATSFREILRADPYRQPSE